MFSKNNHLSEIFSKSKEKLIKKEELEESVIYNGLNSGAMVLLGNTVINRSACQNQNKCKYWHFPFNM